ncbi:MAG: dehydrogenase E1 component subunit alpha/beta, partial [Myxococcota bacterium]
VTEALLDRTLISGGKGRAREDPELLHDHARTGQRGDHPIAGQLMGTTHTSIGQEANAVGVASALNPDDIIVSNHRGHAHFLAHIGDMDGLMAEMMGRETGVCGGWGGSQQLCARNAFYSHGVQGGTLPLATGIALAEKRKGTDRIAVVFLGDGTLGQGALYESFNLASLWDFPILFVIEDNQIAQTTPSRLAVAGSILDRARAFGIRAAELRTPDVAEVRSAAADAVARVRGEHRPFCLLIHTGRFASHSKGDETRPAEEVEAFRREDPLSRMAAAFSKNEIAEMEEQARKRVERACDLAAAAPAARLESLSEAGTAVRRTAAPRAGDARASAILEEVASGTLGERLNHALHGVFERCPEACLLGQDVLDPYGGAFKVSTGLSTKYPDRVLTTPISENAVVGLAGGMALRGLRPVVEIMFGDFLGLCMDPLLNYISKYARMYNGRASVPLVVRTPMGGRRGYGPTHSQTLEKHFLGIPGLEVLAPSPLHPAGAMLEAAVLSDNPVLFVENKVSYGARPRIKAGAMAGDFFAFFAGEDAAPSLCLSLTEFEDERATLICYGGALPLAMEAAVRLLTEFEISVRVLAPGRLYPLDVEGLGELLVPGAPVMTLEEGSLPAGFGAELGAALAERFPGRMGGFGRIGARELPVAAARSLEDDILPQCDAVVRRMISLVDAKHQEQDV